MGEVGRDADAPSGDRSNATSSHTLAACPAPSFVVGAVVPTIRVQYPSRSPDRVISVRSPAVTDSDVSVTSCVSMLVSCSS